MDSEHRKFPPAIEVSDGIEAICGFVVEELSLLLLAPMTTGGFENRGSKSMRPLESNQGGHSAHGHAADGHAVQIETAIAEAEGDVIELGGSLLDVVQKGFCPHELFGNPFSVARQVDRTTSDADSSQPQISARIEFLEGGPPMHPE